MTTVTSAPAADERADSAPTTGAPTDDMKKRLAPFYRPPRTPVLVDVPELAYLMVDGQGAPAEDADAPTSEFQQAIAAIYPTVYTLKFRLKRDGIAMPILPLEALWFTGDGGVFDMSLPPAEWGWRVLIAVSDAVTPELLLEAKAEVRRKRDVPLLDRVRLERWREGLAAQIMHIGPYSMERPTIERLHAFIAEQGLRPRGAHHEIYLGDPRASDPAKLKTGLRQPVTEA